MAKYYEMGEHDVIFTILTDSMELYQSRLHEMREEMGDYSERAAAADYARWILQQSTDNMLELRYPDRRRVHNFKYFTWVEQQGRTYDEIQAQWHQPDYWTSVQQQVDGDRRADRGVQRGGRARSSSDRSATPCPSLPSPHPGLPAAPSPGTWRSRGCWAGTASRCAPRPR